jgi:aspartate racemase
MEKKIGVIGGLGTDTAALFYIELERLWNKAGQTSHVPLVLENIQSSFSLEQSATVSSERVGEFLPFLQKAAQSLETAGSTLTVIPCNTVHVHIGEVRDATTTPVLSITEETAKKLKKMGVKKAAILGTRTTRDFKIYDIACEKEGIQTLYPQPNEQAIIESVIQHALSWTNGTQDTTNLLHVISSMKQQGADAVILACTDLQLCMPSVKPPFVVDSMQTLAEATIQIFIDQSVV